MNVRKASTARDHAGPDGHLTRPRLVTTGSAREPPSTPTGRRLIGLLWCPAGQEGHVVEGSET
jgi:hypothetical protein